MAPVAACLHQTLSPNQELVLKSRCLGGLNVLRRFINRQVGQLCMAGTE